MTLYKLAKVQECKYAGLSLPSRFKRAVLFTMLTLPSVNLDFTATKL